MIDLVEDCYGRRKRFQIVQQIIAGAAARRLLDVGCGTGTMLTLPIARYFPRLEIVGVDTDDDSIAWASAQPHPPNLHFCHIDELAEDERFDVVIASEVLEHVDEPEGFLEWLRSRLTPGGTLVVTTPNGYGPFELLMLAAVLLHGPALRRRMRQLREKVRWTAIGHRPSQTLAVSPHVNFFRMGELRVLFARAGLQVARHRSVTFLSGPGIDGLLRVLGGVEWNARVADRLPACFVSDWLFVLRPTEPMRAAHWQRGAISNFRRRLNLRRWRGDAPRHEPISLP